MTRHKARQSLWSTNKKEGPLIEIQEGLMALEERYEQLLSHEPENQKLYEEQNEHLRQRIAVLSTLEYGEQPNQM